MFEKVRGGYIEKYKGLEQNSYDKEFIYRVLQSGVEFVWPYMTKRRFLVSLEELLYLAYNQSIRFLD